MTVLRAVGRAIAVVIVFAWAVLDELLFPLFRPLIALLVLASAIGQRAQAGAKMIYGMVGEKLGWERPNWFAAPVQKMEPSGKGGWRVPPVRSSSMG